MDCTRCPNLFRFWCGAVKGAARWMVKWSDIVCGLVGISAYARMASEGGTYYPVFIWLPSSAVSQDAQG